MAYPPIERIPLTTTFATKAELRTRFIREYRLMMRTAEMCGCSHSLVSRVLVGLNTSARVENALAIVIQDELQRQAEWREVLIGQEESTQ